VEEAGVWDAIRDGIGCDWTMSDFTFQNLQLNPWTGINSLGLLVLHFRRIWLQGTVILAELEQGGLPKCYKMMKEELFKKITEISNSISEEVLVQMFRNWMTRLGQVINTSGEYIQTWYFKIRFG
jgi:hypothetical protein